jgi:arylsulfatase A-like enzyme
VPAPKNIDGVSVLPALSGKSQRPIEQLYWEHPRYDNKTQQFLNEIPMQAMRRGNLKAVRPKPDAAVEVYDLAADRSEKNNLATMKPGLVEEFDKRLREARTPPREQKEPPHPWWNVKS